MCSQIGAEPPRGEKEQQPRLSFAKRLHGLLHRRDKVRLEVTLLLRRVRVGVDKMQEQPAFSKHHRVCTGLQIRLVVRETIVPQQDASKDHVLLPMVPAHTQAVRSRSQLD